MSDDFIPVDRLKKDLRASAAMLSKQEARACVDAYYQMQDDRIRSAGRVRALDESGEPHAILDWLCTQSGILEKQLLAALDRYSMGHPIGRWMRSVRGVGPVIAAGYLANIDITRAPAVSNIWSFCGVAPGRDRKVKGEKIHFCPSMKRLTFLVGESFKRLGKDDEEAYYRRVYDVRKKYEAEKNENGDYADLAAHCLKVKRYKEDTKAKKIYESGKLPPGHLDRRACRYAAKFFLAHLHEVWWKHEYGKLPNKPYPLPYAIAHLGHAHVVVVPEEKAA